MSDRIWVPDGSTLILLDKKFPQTEGGEMSVAGHIHFGAFPKVGDIAVIEGKEGGKHFFRYSKIDQCANPDAMYTGKIKRFRVEYQGEVIWEEKRQYETLVERVVGDDPNILHMLRKAAGWAVVWAKQKAGIK